MPHLSTAYAVQKCSANTASDVRLPPDSAIRSGSVIDARRTKTPIIRLGRCAAREIHDIIESDKFPLSPRIRTLRAILGKLGPEPAREPLSPPKVYAAPRFIRGRRRRG
jgi:hypothetical protein